MAFEKSKMAPFNKNDLFVKLYEQIEDKSYYKNENLPPVTPYIDKKTLTIRCFIVLIHPLKHCMLILLI